METLESDVRDASCFFSLARQVRETVCDGCWTVLTSVPCVACSENEDSWVMFHGDDFLAEGHDFSGQAG